ncbi:LysR family transcriptional regulator [Streptomyces sp. MBT70]|nr:LysR family transcriptional regulator [Streptomyces sp. MBT70]GGR59150.1 hypothetical protein GCM10010236_09680 [Streptomyces eurythermus]
MTPIALIYSVVIAALELRHLRYLLAVAEHGNFTRAAEEPHISQPTLSQQITHVERTLGVRLPDRTGRAVRPTDAGTAYAEYARRALRDLAVAERAVHDVQDLSRGHLRLAATPTFTAYLIGPVISELHACHPGITLTLTEATQDRIEADLAGDEVDLGIAFIAARQPGIAATPLFTDSIQPLSEIVQRTSLATSSTTTSQPAPTPPPDHHGTTTPTPPASDASGTGGCFRLWLSAAVEAWSLGGEVRALAREGVAGGGPGCAGLGLGSRMYRRSECSPQARPTPATMSTTGASTSPPSRDSPNGVARPRPATPRRRRSTATRGSSPPSPRCDTAGPQLPRDRNRHLLPEGAAGAIASVSHEVTRHFTGTPDREAGN